jgi:subtilisin family serine protease
VQVVHRAICTCAGALALAWQPTLQAQIALPRVPVPDLPAQLPVDVNGTVGAAAGQIDAKQLRGARLVRVRDLLRRNRDVLEADPEGAPIVRSEVLAFSPTEAALEAARAAGFSVLRETGLQELGARIVTLQPPQGISTRRALKELRKLDPGGAYDFNHIYTETGAIDPARQPAGAVEAPSTSPRPDLRIGMIDRGVDATHAVLRDSKVHRHGCNDRAVPDPHGTAVASLIAGQAAQFYGAAPGAEIFAADVFCGAVRGGSVDLIADAFAWLVAQDVPIINVSLVGPRNTMIEHLVRAVLAHGLLIVAAVGNDGPAAPALFPASYDGVIGVTAVDEHRKVLIEAGRGPQVDFAAPGADMTAAIPGEAFGAVRGTSFAAPIVTGLLAAQLTGRGPPAAKPAIATLAGQAIDLGAPGTDPVYGQGLVGEDVRVALAAAGHIEEGSK